MRCSSRSPLGSADGAEPGPVRAARHQPRRRRPPLHRPPRRLLRAPGRAAAAARSSPRAPASTTSDWPYERAPLAARAAAGWAAIVAACHAARRARPRLARPRRRAGLVGLQPAPLWAPSRVPEVNTREVPKWMEADDIAAVVDGFAAAAAARRRGRLRRRRDQRRPAQPRAPVPVRADQPARRRVGRRPAALRPRRARRGARRRRRRPRRRAAAVVRRARAVGRASRRSRRRRSPPTLVAVGVDYVVVVRGSIFSVEQTRPDFHQPTGFNVDAGRPASRAAVDVPVVPAGLGRRRRPGRVGASAATTTRRRATASR